MLKPEAAAHETLARMERLHLVLVTLGTGPGRDPQQFNLQSFGREIEVISHSLRVQNYGERNIKKMCKGSVFL